MMLPKVTHIHSSSKYSGVTGLLTRTARDYFAVADIVTWTEIEAEARERAIREASEEFFLVSGDRSYANDCGISLRKKRFKVLYTENFKSTNVNFYDKGGNKKDPQWATTAVVEDRLTQRRTVITVIHLASGIEGDMREGKRTKAIINWYASFRGAKKRANKLRKQYKAHAVLFIADFNLDFKAEWVRRAIKSVAPAYRATWNNLKVKGGTHVHRIIDATLVWGRMAGSARLYADDGSSDHRPYVEELRYT